ncbi:peptidase C2, calpain family, partial [Kipferlia bialata]
DEAIAWVAESEWSRMGDLCEDPCLFDDSISPEDINQGGIGNCWMCGQVSGLATQNGRHVRGAIYPPHINPSGIYGVRVFRRGKWYMIIVDDHIPCQGQSVTSVKSKNRNEWWGYAALAKVSGSYQDLSAGMGIGLEPVQVFTGCNLYIHCSNDAENIWTWLKRLFDAGVIVSAGTQDAQTEQTGLVQGHAYTVLGVYENTDLDLRLVKMRNTWGAGGEWKGDFSDSCPMWQQFPQLVEETGVELHRGDSDGIFYMPVEAFTTHFKGFRAFPTCAWPPAGEDIPASLTKPMPQDYCYSNDYKIHTGTEGYEVTTSVAVPVPGPRPGQKTTVYHAYNQPQYMFDVTKEQDIRIRVQGEKGSEGGYPSLHIVQVPNDGSALTYRAMRRMDLVDRGETDGSSSVPHHIGYSMLTSWMERHLSIGRYVLALRQGKTDGSALTLQCKAATSLSFVPLPSGSMACCAAQTKGGEVGGFANPQYSFVVDGQETQKITVDLEFPSAVYGDGGDCGFYLVKRPTHKRLEDAPEGDGFFEDAQADMPGYVKGVWDLEPGIYVIVPWRTEGKAESYTITVGTSAATLSTKVYGLG